MFRRIRYRCAGRLFSDNASTGDPMGGTHRTLDEERQDPHTLVFLPCGFQQSATASHVFVMMTRSPMRLTT
jgi:hypothetical protein